MRRGAGSVRRARQSLFAALVAPLALIVGAPASGDPAVSISAATLSLAPGESNRVVVASRQAGSGAASMAVETPPGVRAVARALGDRGPVRHWLVTFAAGSSFATGGSAIVLVRSGVGLATGSIELRPRAETGIGARLKAEVALEGDTLLDGLARPLLVRVENATDLPIDVALRPRLPAFIVPLTGAWQAPLTLPPRSTTVVRLPIVTSSSRGQVLLGGRQRLSVDVVAVEHATGRWLGRVEASTSVNVGVPGMSEVQGLLQIPSFLLLPGFLLLTAFVLSRRAIRAAAGEGPTAADVLSVTWSSGLWLIAITASMAMVALYPVMCWLFGYGWRDILYGFDIGDVVRVWVASLLLGAIAALVVRAWELWRRRRSALSEFREDLTPFEVLDRLRWRGMSASLPFATLDDADDTRLYRLGGDLDGGMTWASSMVVCRVVDPTRPGFDVAGLDAMLQAGEPRAIAESLRSAERCGAVVVGWPQRGAVLGIARVEHSKFAEVDPPASIVVVE